MKKSPRAENPGLRVMIVATALLFVVLGSGCGAEHAGQIIGMDPVQEQGGASPATAAPT